MESISGFPHWGLDFNEEGQLVEPPSAEEFLTEVGTEQLTDIFVFSHGWNNNRAAAKSLYERFFNEVQAILQGPHGQLSRAAKIGTAGVIWPSMRWADEEDGTGLASDLGGAASVSAAVPTDVAAPQVDGAVVSDLKQVFRSQTQQAALDAMAQLLADHPNNNEALAQFQALMRQFAKQRDVVDAPEDHGEYDGLLGPPPDEVFERMAAVAPPQQDEGGALFLGNVNPFDTLWSGAKQALRLLTYSEMKKRAGVVGQEGLGPVLGRLAGQPASPRVHLLGHSFGARLVSFSVAGLPQGVTSVKSVILLQGAFSHYTFADRLPHDSKRGGVLAGMLKRIDGPLMVSFSEHDRALSYVYPLASMRQRQDAQFLDRVLQRWGAMGYDGAQAVQATTVPMGNVGQTYTFSAGTVLNLDANDVIKKLESRISGAHGDIVHPETAWVALAAAGLVGRSSGGNG